MMHEEQVCKNCRHVLPAESNYCAHCGQETKNLHVSFWEMVKDYLSSNFNFDTKLWLTLHELLFNPGFLLKEFIKGRRARYVPPVRLYFFISFVYFLLLGISFEPTSTETNTDSVMNLQLDSLTSAIVDPESDALITGGLHTTDPENTLQIDSLLSKIEVTPTEQTRHMARQAIKLYQSRDGFRQEFFKNLSLAMFFLMPVFALLFWLFAARPRLFYIDAVVFSVHVHAFFFLFSSFIIIVRWWFPAEWLTNAMVVMLVGYIIIGLWRLQNISWKRAFCYTALVLLFYMFIVAFTLALLGAISAWRF
jgi:hypothetical protein